MAKICLYFQLHQPYRLNEYSFFQIGKHNSYFNDEFNADILNKIASNCYLKTNELLLKLIEKYGTKIQLNFGLSGSVISQFENYNPAVIDSFKKLAKTGCVDFLSETYFHSLASLFNFDEFQFQVKKHAEKIESLFDIKPTIFRNTELIFRNDIAEKIYNLGFKAVLTEGVERKTNQNSVNQIYQTNQLLPVFLRNYNLSDDIAFRFSDPKSELFPITAIKIIKKIKTNLLPTEIITIGMDYETFGEHFDDNTTIFKFLESFISTVIEDNALQFSTFKAIDFNQDIEKPLFNSEEIISWADTEKDGSAWLGNSMQYEALSKIYELNTLIKHVKNLEIVETWRKLQISDHFYYMSTKYFSDGDVHSYFSHYKTPYDAYINYMNILSDFEILVKKELSK